MDLTRSAKSRKNNEDLCRLAREGSPEARALLLEQNMPFYRTIAGTVWNQHQKQCRDAGLEIDDLLQTGLMKLDNGIDTYRPDWGATFLTYIRHVMHNAMIDEIRCKASRCISCGEYDMRKKLRDNRGEYLNSRYEPPEEKLLREETEQALAGAWDALPNRYQHYLQYRFGLEKDKVHSLKQTARHFSISCRRSRKIEREAQSFLRRELAHRPNRDEVYSPLQFPDDCAQPEEPWEDLYRDHFQTGDAFGNPEEALKKELEFSDPL